MKKTYISPITLATEVAMSQMVAQSAVLDRTEGNKLNSSDAILVKDQASGYNVWSDDWSN